MGLAPYGEPKFAKLILDNLIDLKPDGSFRLDIDYFDYCTGLTHDERPGSTALFGGPARKPEELLTQRHMDLAASIQAVTEEVVLRLTRYARRARPARENLCLAGGVALNCVANGKVLRDGSVRATSGSSRRPAMPAARSGAALAAYHLLQGREPRRLDGELDGMAGAYLGPELRRRPTSSGRLTRGRRAASTVLDDDALIERDRATRSRDGKAVGWFQGRMEFGPRALGTRSILGDPRSPACRTTLNLKVKYREVFRPFAPAVLREDVADWFELDADSPYMLLVADVVKRRAGAP